MWIHTINFWKCFRIGFLLVVLLSPCVYVTPSPIFEERQDIKATDYAPTDFYGSVVRVEPEVLFISAYNKGNSRGTVYVYGATEFAPSWYPNVTILSGSGESAVENLSPGSTPRLPENSTLWQSFIKTKVWTQQAELLASDGTQFDLFGIDIATCRNALLVGAQSKIPGGAAYVFGSYNDAGQPSLGLKSVWTQQAKLLPSDSSANILFGSSVSIFVDESASIATAIIGANGRTSYAGAAYIFTSMKTSPGSHLSIWSQVARLQAVDSMPHDNFGLRVAIVGSTVAASAYGHNSGAGAVYIFSSSSATPQHPLYSSWTAQAKLVAADASPGDSLGYSLCMSSNLLVMGALTGDHGSNSGSVYVFARGNTGNTSYSWSFLVKLLPADGQAGDYFGLSVSLSSISNIVVGAPYTGSREGTVYLFTEVSAMMWSQQAKFQPINGRAQIEFGRGLSISPDGIDIAIGAYDYDDRMSSTYSGTVYYFHDMSAPPPPPIALPAVSNVAIGVCLSLSLIFGIVLARVMQVAGEVYGGTDDTSLSILRRAMSCSNDAPAVFFPADTVKRDVPDKEQYPGNLGIEADARRIEEAEQAPPEGSPGRWTPSTSPSTSMDTAVQDPIYVDPLFGELRTEKVEFHEHFALAMPAIAPPPISVLSPQNVSLAADSGNASDENDGTSDSGLTADSLLTSGSFTKEVLTLGPTEVRDETKARASSPFKNLNGWDYFIDFPLAVVATTSSYIFIYILADRQESAIAAFLLAVYAILTFLPFSIISIDMIQPKMIGRSISSGITRRHLDAASTGRALSDYIVFISAMIFSLDLVRYLPWRPSSFSIASKGFPTYRTFQMCSYCGLLLFAIQLTVQAVVLTTPIELTSSPSATSVDDIARSGGWAGIINIFLLSLRIIHCIHRFVVPVWTRGNSLHAAVVSGVRKSFTLIIGQAESIKPPSPSDGGSIGEWDVMQGTANAGDNGEFGHSTSFPVPSTHLNLRNSGVFNSQLDQCTLVTNGVTKGESVEMASYRERNLADSHSNRHSHPYVPSSAGARAGAGAGAGATNFEMELLGHSPRSKVERERDRSELRRQRERMHTSEGDLLLPPAPPLSMNDESYGANFRERRTSSQSRGARSDSDRRSKASIRFAPLVDTDDMSVLALNDEMPRVPTAAGSPVPSLLSRTVRPPPLKPPKMSPNSGSISTINQKIPPVEDLGSHDSSAQETLRHVPIEASDAIGTLYALHALDDDDLSAVSRGRPPPRRVESPQRAPSAKNRVPVVPPLALPPRQHNAPLVDVAKAVNPPITAIDTSSSSDSSDDATADDVIIVRRHSTRKKT